MEAMRANTTPKQGEQLAPERELAYAIAEMVRGLRKERGWSGTDLEKESGIKQPHIARLEGANKGLPSLQTLLRIASATNTRLVIAFENKETDGS